MPLPPNLNDIPVSVENFKAWMKDYELERMRDEFLSRIITLVIASLGLMAALAWDQVLKDLLAFMFRNQDSVWQHISYAVIVTLLAAVASIVLTKVFIKRKKKGAKPNTQDSQN